MIRILNDSNSDISHFFNIMLSTYRLCNNNIPVVQNFVLYKIYKEIEYNKCNDLTFNINYLLNNYIYVFFFLEKNFIL